MEKMERESRMERGGLKLQGAVGGGIEIMQAYEQKLNTFKKGSEQASVAI